MTKAFAVVLMFALLQSCAPHICEKQYGLKSHIDIDKDKIVGIDTVRNPQGGVVKVVRYWSWEKEK